MIEIYGLPQPLTGAETITIHQLQNGNMAKCTMLLSDLIAMITNNITSSLSTQKPDTAGMLWNDGGVVSVS